MLSSRGGGRDFIMRAVPVAHRYRQVGSLLAGLGLMVVVAWMLVTAWFCAYAIDDPAVMARSTSAAGPSARAIAPPGDHPPKERFSAARVARSEPLMVDRSRDRRADLMDMAISLRWHRGAPSGLPPGSE